MALTESYMLPLGTQAPKFKLLDVIENKDKSLQELKGEKRNIDSFHVQSLSLCSSLDGCDC